MSYDANIQRLPDPFYNNGVGFISAGVKGVYTGTQHPLNGGGVVSVEYSGSYWEIDISYPETLQQELTNTLAFLEGLSGSFTPFYILMPQHRYPATGIWNTSTAAKRAQGEIVLVNPNTIKIGGWSNRGGDLNPGDMIKFSEMSKIYKITSKEHNTTTDEVVFRLSSNIKYPSKLALSGLEPNDIKFKVRLKGNKSPAPILRANGIYSSFSLSMREDVTDE